MRYLRWRWVPIVLLTLSVTIHLVTVLAYSRQPDALAAFTVLPLWVWGFVGLSLAGSAFVFFRSVGGLFFSALWALTLLMLCDEARVIGHFAAPSLKPTTPDQRHIRVATLNCSSLRTDHTLAIKSFVPDIIFLQEMMHPMLVRHLITEVFDNKADYRFHQNCCVIVRGSITRELRNPFYRTQHLTAQLEKGLSVELVNVHFVSAETRLDLWNPQAWREHRNNRIQRRKELAISLRILEEATEFPNVPAIFAGDFNAGMADSVHTLMARDFENAFSEVGRGWPNTYHAKFPFIRIDHIYASRHFTPYSARVFEVPNTDHRLLVADLRMTQ